MPINPTISRKEEAMFTPTENAKKLFQVIYREKNKPTNVLAFPLSASAGHIIICPEKARVEAPEFDKTPLEFIGFLFIHALLHLKGLTHGSRMESEERKFYALLMRGSSPSRIHGKKNMRRN